ncbi:prepilin peptidase [Leeia oryzae]|uniref:prepilin peptidase n=1 Tax=Leeia oryzae TaxID=356662 RepID=UPI00036A1C39|nr:A24 family peptidase [Leeia oryzae]
MSNLPLSFLIVVFFVFGLLIGSFLNVVIYRLPKMMERGWLTDMQAGLDEASLIIQGEGSVPALANARSAIAAHLEKAPAFNLAHPRSACPQCGHQISALENIPVFSYLFLGGKCRHCKTRISVRYPLIELFTGSLAALSAALFAPYGLSIAMAAFAFLAVLLVLAWIDLDTMLLPDSLTLPLMWAGLLFSWHGGFTSLGSALLGAAGGYLLLWSVYWLFKLVTGKEGMGYGDFKLLAAIGAWLGWQVLPQTILIASAAGAVIGITMIVLGNKTRQQAIPFGPYLAIGGAISLFAGNFIL